MSFLRSFAMISFIAWTAATSGTAEETKGKLSQALTFHASFDEGVSADVAKGSANLFTITATKPKQKTEKGLLTEGKTTLEKDAGLGGKGGALKFSARNAKWIYYPAENNVPYKTTDWSGTVSLWLKLDPADLDPGYNDPVQLTTRTWNDGSFFVDFDKSGDPRDFRLGVFPDLTVWNPEKKEVPEDKRPLFKVSNPPFSKAEWTHVAFTWRNFNNGDKKGVATFYLNGKRQGQITGWQQTFTWKEDEEKRLYLGLNYQGLLDDVSCFNRALSDKEVAAVFAAKDGLRTLLEGDS